ncbi:serine/arginine repetitive matrix protein 2-like [Lutra lutra]|uniref:serine/arginine repetitive matrix protein 2-like n=1 Tax=Lutra lutra TaxID=9657 RepID=UPI001FD169C1|nr:serine/arginine repetitive matrix protein 2-like [Lutra lutra]
MKRTPQETRHVRSREPPCVGHFRRPLPAGGAEEPSAVAARSVVPARGFPDLRRSPRGSRTGSDTALDPPLARTRARGSCGDRGRAPRAAPSLPPLGLRLRTPPRRSGQRRRRPRPASERSFWNQERDAGVGKSVAGAEHAGTGALSDGTEEEKSVIAGAPPSPARPGLPNPTRRRDPRRPPRGGRVSVLPTAQAGVSSCSRSPRRQKVHRD